MPRRLIVALSGEIATGKSTLANKLGQEFGFHVFKTKDVLKRIHEGKPPGRKTLQQLGEGLDNETKGGWILTHFQKEFSSKLNQCGFFVVDAVRIVEQVVALRQAFGRSVIHVHLRCSEDELLERYVDAHGEGRKRDTIKKEYQQAKTNATEKQVSSLGVRSDVLIDTHRTSANDVIVRVAAYLGLLSDPQKPVVDVVVGAQFGSEGKGQICAHLAPEYDALVRVGGPNAGHTVFADPPLKFHLLPSGLTRAPHAKLILGPGAVIDLKVLLKEIEEHNISTDRLVVDSNATIISPADKHKEKRLVREIGSTGQGVGAATARNVMRLDGHKHKASFFGKRLRGFLGDAQEEIQKLVRKEAKILLEGTQGTGLSLNHGDYPFVTSRDTTASGCLAEAGIGPKMVRRVILVTRSYPIRVKNPDGGSSGDFWSKELDWGEISNRSGISREDLERNEITTTTRRQRRVGEFSWVQFRKACELNSPTDIALTFVDYISNENEKARRFEQLTQETVKFVEELERCAGVPVSLIGTRFEYRCIIDRRSWKAAYD